MLEPNNFQADSTAYCHMDDGEQCLKCGSLVDVEEIIYQCSGRLPQERSRPESLLPAGGQSPADANGTGVTVVVDVRASISRKYVINLLKKLDLKIFLIILKTRFKDLFNNINYVR